MASSSDCKNAVIQELLTGRDFTNQLLQLVRHGSKSNIVDNNLGDHHHHQDSSLLIIRPFVEDLVKKILNSFTNTLFLFNSSTNNICDDIPLISDSSPKSEKKGFHGSCKSLSTTIPRGCYKRKRSTIETWEKLDSPILVEDGHAWRKYGQKMTRNTKYLRNYYRCSHKYEHGCSAMKQVQRIQEKPPLYRTTYYGLHTCKNHHMIPLNPSSPSDNSSSILISFNNTNTISTLPTKQDHPFVSSSSSSSSTKKEEHIDEEDDQIIINVDDDHDHDHDVQQNINVPQYDHVTALSSTLDLFSSVKVESFEVDDVILRSFDFDEFVRFGL